MTQHHPGRDMDTTVLDKVLSDDILIPPGILHLPGDVHGINPPESKPFLSG